MGPKRMQKGGARLQTTRHWRETSLGLLTLSSPSGACPLSRWPCISRYDNTYRIPSSIRHLRCPGSLKRHLNTASPAWPGPLPLAANQEPAICHNSGHTRRVHDTCDQHEASHGSRTRPAILACRASCSVLRTTCLARRSSTLLPACPAPSRWHAGVLWASRMLRD